MASDGPVPTHSVQAEIHWLIPKVYHGHGHVCCGVASLHTTPASSLPLWEVCAWQGFELCCPESLTPMVGSSCLLSLSISTRACIMIAQLVPHHGWSYANHYLSYLLLIALFFSFSSCWFSLVSSWLPLFLPSPSFPSSLLSAFSLYKFT